MDWDIGLESRISILKRRRIVHFAWWPNTAWAKNCKGKEEDARQPRDDLSTPLLSIIPAVCLCTCTFVSLSFTYLACKTTPGPVESWKIPLSRPFVFLWLLQLLLKLTNNLMAFTGMTSHVFHGTTYLDIFSKKEKATRKLFNNCIFQLDVFPMQSWWNGWSVGTTGPPPCCTYLDFGQRGRCKK